MIIGTIYSAKQSTMHFKQITSFKIMGAIILFSQRMKLMFRDDQSGK